MARVAGVYKIIRIGTDQCYVGSSAWISKRWQTHRRELRKNKHTAHRLQNSWNKYGASAFDFLVLETCEGEGEALKKRLAEREQYWMDMFCPCFNVCRAAGSTLGYKMPREIVERHRQLITGRKLAPEHAAIVRNLALGLKRTPETKEKQRANGLRRGMSELAIINSANARRGQKLTPEHVEKIRIASSQYRHTLETREKMKASNTCEVRSKKGAAGRGKKQSPEHIGKRVAAMVRTKAMKKEVDKLTANSEAEVSATAPITLRTD